MSTLGWLFILVAGIVLRQVAKGRVMDTTQDVSDAFLAIVSGDTKAFNEVLARTGDYNSPDRADTGDTSGAGGSVDPGKYNLSNKTKDITVRAVNTLGPMFGIKTVGGWRAQGSVPGSKHPQGLAADLMIDDISNGHAVGERLAKYAVSNANTFGITEVIWNRRIWTRAKGWHEYRGPSAHTDHVHLTFKG